MDNNKLTQLWEINYNSEKELGLFIYCSVEWVVFKHFSNGNVNAVRVKDGFVSTFSEDEILNNCLLIQ